MAKHYLPIFFLVVFLGAALLKSSDLSAHEDEPAEAGAEDVAPLDAEDLPPTDLCRAKGETCGAKAKKSKVKECCKSLVCVEGRCQKYQETEMPCGKGMPPCMPGLKCLNDTCQ